MATFAEDTKNEYINERLQLSHGLVASYEIQRWRNLVGIYVSVTLEMIKFWRSLTLSFDPVS